MTYQRLLAAMVVSRPVRERVLHSKTRQDALEQGYLGKDYLLEPDEKQFLLTHEFKDLTDLAQQIIDEQGGGDLSKTRRI